MYINTGKFYYIFFIHKCIVKPNKSELTNIKSTKVSPNGPPGQKDKRFFRDSHKYFKDSLNVSKQSVPKKKRKRRDNPVLQYGLFYGTSSKVQTQRL